MEDGEATDSISTVLLRIYSPALAELNGIEYHQVLQSARRELLQPGVFQVVQLVCRMAVLGALQRPLTYIAPPKRLELIRPSTSAVAAYPAMTSRARHQVRDQPTRSKSAHKATPSHDKRRLLPLIVPYPCFPGPLLTIYPT